MECDEGRLALITVDGEEVLTYEFLCKSGENEYLVYVDAETKHAAPAVKISHVFRLRFLDFARNDNAPAMPR